jgi:hypothetical protein
MGGGNKGREEGSRAGLGNARVRKRRGSGRKLLANLTTESVFIMSEARISKGRIRIPGV